MPQSKGVKSKTPALSIVYRDEWIVVVNKPAGLLVIPSPKGETNTLTSLLNRQLSAEPAAGDRPRPQAHPAHRIDRDTSGIVVYALGKSMQQKLMDQFAERLVHKTYIAVVNGVPGKKEGMLNQSIEGQDAQTRYKVLGSTAAFSVVAALPVTGRTNQIRIHFARMGHALLGDNKFGIRKDFSIQAKRTALHAYKIEFSHPVSGLPLVFSVPVPGDIADFARQAGVDIPRDGV
jgi:23S rRNA pseudouridine1911/1915/1917 synthase